MNPALRKTINDIERTKAKIAELETLLPELERKKTALENDEIIKAVRQANIAPGEITAFIETLKAGSAPTQPPASSPTPASRQEAINNEE